MIIKVARFKVRPDQVSSAEQAIVAFVDAIAQFEPKTSYEAFRAGDGVSFVHFMAFPDAEAERAHQTAPYTMQFVNVLYPICEEQPDFTALALVRKTGG